MKTKTKILLAVCGAVLLFWSAFGITAEVMTSRDDDSGSAGRAEDSGENTETSVGYVLSERYQTGDIGDEAFAEFIELFAGPWFGTLLEPENREPMDAMRTALFACNYLDGGNRATITEFATFDDPVFQDLGPDTTNTWFWTAVDRVCPEQYYSPTLR